MIKMKLIYEIHIEYIPVFSVSIREYFQSVDDNPQYIDIVAIEEHVAKLMEKEKRFHEESGEMLYPEILKAWVKPVYEKK